MATKAKSSVRDTAPKGRRGSASAAKALKKYQGMRDFTQTAEPSGHEAAHEGGHAFVVQKHAASHLHYDFRLEMDGVLKSWAVAKGPSVDPAVKRLAMQTEDHPLAYGGFEGIIPKGQYGGGTVMLWDRGTWESIGDAHETYRSGRLKFRLNGDKMHGQWALVRMKPKPNERNPAWLLIKDKDEYAAPGEPDALLENDKSVKSGRDMKHIAESTKDVWISDRAGKADQMPVRTPKKKAPPKIKTAVKLKAGMNASAMRKAIEKATGRKVAQKKSPRGRRTS